MTEAAVALQVAPLRSAAVNARISRIEAMHIFKMKQTHQRGKPAQSLKSFLFSLVQQLRILFCETFPPIWL